MQNLDSNKIKIISEPSKENPFLVLYKPRNLASAPLKEGDDSAYSQALLLFPELKKVRGIKEVEGGLVHRIDTLTDGLLLIASDQDFYDYIMAEQKKGLFIKEYTAFCNRLDFLMEGFPFFDKELFSLLLSGKEVSVKSYFRPFGSKGSSVRPVVKDEKAGRAALKKAGSKEYETFVLIEKTEDESLYKARCKITSGYRHQVRCHLSWAGFPVTGDALYNPFCDKNDFSFTASSLEFNHPFTAKKVRYSLESENFIEDMFFI